jgi:hypothetical protein
VTGVITARDGWEDSKIIEKTIVALKQTKKSRFAELIKIKTRLFSFLLQLFEVEYKVAWRFLLRTQETVLSAGDI